MQHQNEFHGIVCGDMQDNIRLGYVSVLFSRQDGEHVVQGMGTVLLESMKAIMYRVGAKKIALGALSEVVGYYKAQGMIVDGFGDGEETPMSRRKRGSSDGDGPHRSKRGRQSIR